MLENIRRATPKERADPRQTSLYGQRHEEELKRFYTRRTIRHTQEPDEVSTESFAIPVPLQHAEEYDVINGITIREANRATRFEYYASEIVILAKIAKENYLDKGINAVLVKVPTKHRPFHKVAVYVEEGFLVPVSRSFSERDSD